MNLHYEKRVLSTGDVDHLIGLLHQASQIDGQTNPILRSEIIEQLEKPDLPETSISYWDQGRLIAYGIVRIQDNMSHEIRANLDGTVQPEYRGKGIGTELLQWEEDKTRVLVKKDDSRPVILRIDYYDKDDTARQLYEQRGFINALAEDEMELDLEPFTKISSLPDDAKLFSWNESTIPEFYEVYVNAFKTRPGFPNWSQERWVEHFTNHDEFDPELSLLLTMNEEPAGYVLTHIEEDSGYIVQMGIHPNWRRQGLASGLLSEILTRYQSEDLPLAELDVNVNNEAARKLYEKLGFRFVKCYHSYRKVLG